jgi:GAF domain-containing protein/HAMP domain-containing protein
MSTEADKEVVSRTERLSRWAHLRYGVGRSLLIWFLLLPVASLVVAGVIMGVYRWFPNLQMVLMAEQEMSEATASTHGMLITGLAALLVVIGIAVGTALLVSERITRPLADLTATANLIAAGDTSHEVPHTDHQDEIGTLARAFNQMTQQLRDSITGLEEQVAERTRQLQEANYKLQRRAIQFEVSAQVGRAITSILNLDDLLAEVVNLIRNRFGFYHAGIFLLDESNEWAVLRQATGEAGQRMLAKKHRLAVGSESIVGWVAANHQPRVALDVGADAVHFKNPELPHTRSEIALPLIVGDRLLGVLDVQSTEEAAFDEEDMAILSLMADQVTVAIENALKFSQEAAILEATSPFYRASRSITLATSLDDVLKGIVSHAAGPHVDRCTINFYTSLAEDQEPTGVEVAALWDRADDPPSPPGTRYPTSLFVLAKRLSHGVMEPLVTNDLLADVADARLDDESRHWLIEHLQIRAVLMLPLVSARRPVGLLVVASRQPHTWIEDELSTFRSLSGQVAIAVENARLFHQIETASHRERQINQITDRMRRSFDMEVILKTTVQELSEAIGATQAFAYLGPEDLVEREAWSVERSDPDDGR